MGKKSLIVQYFIPEDGDTEESPNMFYLKNTGGFSPRLKDVKASFPLPGKYLFRFKAPVIPGTDRDKNSIFVWIDCIHDEQNVSVWRNSIVAKVTRIGIGNYVIPNINSTSHMATYIPTMSPKVIPYVSSTNKCLDIPTFDSQSTTTKFMDNSSEPLLEPSCSTSVTLLDVNAFDSKVSLSFPTPPRQNSMTESLLDMNPTDVPGQTPHVTTTSSEPTLLDMMDVPTMQDSPIYNSLNNDLLGTISNTSVGSSKPTSTTPRREMTKLSISSPLADTDSFGGLEWK